MNHALVLSLCFRYVLRTFVFVLAFGEYANFMYFMLNNQTLNVYIYLIL